MIAMHRREFDGEKSQFDLDLAESRSLEPLTELNSPPGPLWRARLCRSEAEESLERLEVEQVARTSPAAVTHTPLFSRCTAPHLNYGRTGVCTGNARISRSRRRLIPRRGRQRRRGGGVRRRRRKDEDALCGGRGDRVDAHAARRAERERVCTQRRRRVPLARRDAEGCEDAEVVREAAERREEAHARVLEAVARPAEAPTPGAGSSGGARRRVAASPASSLLPHARRARHRSGQDAWRGGFPGGKGRRRR